VHFSNPSAVGVRQFLCQPPADFMRGEGTLYTERMDRFHLIPAFISLRACSPDSWRGALHVVRNGSSKSDPAEILSKCGIPDMW
jgi:hypothetical protein